MGKVQSINDDPTGRHPGKTQAEIPKAHHSALIWLANPIANVIKASGHRSAHKGRTYGRNAPYGSDRKKALDRGVVPHMGIPIPSENSML